MSSPQFFCVRSVVARLCIQMCSAAVTMQVAFKLHVALLRGLGTARIK